MLGLIILRLDHVILKGRIVLNVDLDGIDPIIPKGKIAHDICGLGLVILKGRII